MRIRRSEKRRVILGWWWALVRLNGEPTPGHNTRAIIFEAVMATRPGLDRVKVHEMIDEIGRCES